MDVIQHIGFHFDTSEAISNPNPYTFSNDTLIIDLFLGMLGNNQLLLNAMGI